MSNQTLAPPRRVRDLISAIKNDPLMGKGITVLGERATEFSDPLVHKMVGIAAHEPARRHFEYNLDEMWATTPVKDHDEIVVGGGFHAAVYASVRCRGGFGKPLVLEESERAGGAFAVSRGPSFYLNSRNRPGGASLPGIDRGALNVIPGGVIQPADLSGDEYQRNSDLAFSIRCALSMCADVRTSARVSQIRRAPEGHTRMWEVYVSTDRSTPATKVYCDRVVLATGIGKSPKSFADACLSYDRVLSFTDFMSRMDEPFPTRGMRRVAVIGGGDSGRTAVEALTGQGPTTKMSVAALDFVEQIDWYGTASAGILTRDNWVACNRSRYKGIGRLFPKVAGGAGRIQPKQKANNVGGGYECAYVDEVPYDYVIVCTGNAPVRTTSLVRGDVSGPTTFEAGERNVALYYENENGDEGEEIYIVGPAAGIDLGPTEQQAINGGSGVIVPENSTALFRYATRTAMLASVLGKPYVRRVDRPSASPDEPNGTDPRPLVLRGNGNQALDANGRVMRKGDYFIDTRNPDRRGFLTGESGGSGTVVRTTETISGRTKGNRYCEKLEVVPFTRDKNGANLYVGDAVTKNGYAGTYYLAGICDDYNQGIITPDALRGGSGVFYAMLPLDDTGLREVSTSFKFKGEPCIASFSNEMTKA